MAPRFQIQTSRTPSFRGLSAQPWSRYAKGIGEVRYAPKQFWARAVRGFMLRFPPAAMREVSLVWPVCSGMIALTACGPAAFGSGGEAQAQSPPPATALAASSESGQATQATPSEPDMSCLTVVPEKAWAERRALRQAVHDQLAVFNACEPLAPVRTEVCLTLMRPKKSWVVGVEARGSCEFKACLRERAKLVRLPSAENADLVPPVLLPLGPEKAQEAEASPTDASDCPTDEKAVSADPGPTSIEPKSDAEGRLIGRLAPAEIQERVRAHYADFRRCYEAGLTRNRQLSGLFQARFVIGVDGKVSSVSISHNSLPDCACAECIMDQFKRIVFPKPEGGVVTVVYPIAFEPR